MHLPLVDPNDCLFRLRVPTKEVVSTMSFASVGGEDTDAATGNEVGGCEDEELLLLQLPVLVEVWLSDFFTSLEGAIVLLTK